MTPLVDEPWAKFPVSLLDIEGLTLADIRLYVYLDYKAGRRGWWYGSQRQITDDTGIEERTCRRAKERLVAGGYIAVERMGRDEKTVNKYLVLARTKPVETDGADNSDRSTTDNGDRSTDYEREMSGAERAQMTGLTILPTDPTTDLVPDARAREPEADSRESEAQRGGARGRGAAAAARLEPGAVRGDGLAPGGGRGGGAGGTAARPSGPPRASQILTLADVERLYPGGATAP